MENIIITPSAMQELKRRYKGENLYIRVEAVDTYECSTMLTFYLTEEQEPRKDDFVHIEDTIHLLLDEKAQQEIGDYLKLDFVSSQGFKLVNVQQILAYGLRIRQKEE